MSQIINFNQAEAKASQLLSLLSGLKRDCEENNVNSDVTNLVTLSSEIADSLVCWFLEEPSQSEILNVNKNNHLAVDIILKIYSLLNAALNLNDDADCSLRIETLNRANELLNFELRELLENE